LGVGLRILGQANLSICVNGLLPQLSDNLPLPAFWINLLSLAW